MPTALLLLREESTCSSLASLVEKSQLQKQPLPKYELQISPKQLDLILCNSLKCQNPKLIENQKIPDEGFESDIDTISIISSDGSLVSTSEPQKNSSKEVDSGHGSASSSDSDSDHHEQNFTHTSIAIETNPPKSLLQKESYNLVDCVCYTDIRVPDVLIFLIKKEAFVFKFENLTQLRNFYLNFTALKAVCNQITYNNSPTKFNLLHRTDQNGVQHIEITRETQNIWQSVRDFPENSPSARSKIISLNTPDISLKERRLVKNQRLTSSTENLLVDNNKKNEKVKKIWNSTENILDSLAARPAPPERRKKGRAPPPPILTTSQNILRGEYVRVNVNNIQEQNFIAKSSSKTHTIKPELLWTNSVPRILKNKLRITAAKPEIQRLPPVTPRQIDNRLFGLSSQLRSFPAIEDQKTASEWFQNIEEENNNKASGANLKSVIKKVDNKKKNKKVTFSAYATVQVV